MLDKEVINYLNDHLPTTSGLLKSLETQASEQMIPIMDPLSMHFVEQLMKIKQPNNVLEIGTAIGYSALRMSLAYPKSSITTIEINEKRYEEAISNIEKLNKENNIEVLLGDALEILPSLQKKGQIYDMVFIDAAKGKYLDYFTLSEPLLANQAMIISDNVLFRGYVAGMTAPEHRHVKLVQKLKQYNDWLMSNSKYTTSMVPIGDGLAISVKK